MSDFWIVITTILFIVVAVFGYYAYEYYKYCKYKDEDFVDITPKDISEPVHLILKAMEERPETFILYSKMVKGIFGVIEEGFIDRKTHFKVSRRTYRSSSHFKCSGGFNLTNDEALALEKAAKDLHNQREEVRKQEKARKEKENRDKWSKRYMEV